MIFVSSGWFSQIHHKVRQTNSSGLLLIVYISVLIFLLQMHELLFLYLEIVLGVMLELK